VFREIFALGGVFRLPHRLQTALLDAIDPLRASAGRDRLSALLQSRSCLEDQAGKA
jgi:hypothetical protein